MATVVERISLVIDGRAVDVERLSDGTFRRPAYLLGATREIVGSKVYGDGHVQNSAESIGFGGCDPAADTRATTAPATPEARRWSGFGTALKPASEFWILARKPLGSTVAECVLAHGTGALNIDAARVRYESGGTVASNPMLRREGGLKTLGGIGFWGNGSERPEMGNPAGRWPANLVLSHAAWEETHCPCGTVLSFVARFCPECGSGRIEHRRAGCCAVGERRVKGAQWSEKDRAVATGDFFDGATRGDAPMSYADPDGLETVTAWECLATCGCGLSTLAPSGGAAPRCRCGRAMAWACPVARLDEQSGELHSQDPATRRSLAPSSSHLFDGMSAKGMAGNVPGDSGGASRFFNTFAPPDDTEPFFWCAKPSAAETEAGCERLPIKSAAENVDREEGSDGMKSPRAGAGRTSGRRNHHPTKKPIALTRHFCRLVCPPGGIVLDLFAGSGTTIAAALLEGMRAIGIEMDPEFVAIGKARAAFWGRLAGTKAATVAKPRPVREKVGAGQGSLF